MNEALAYPVFQPAMRILTDITRTYPAVVTTGLITYPGGVTTITPFDHSYVSGMIIRLVVPSFFGMVQADGLYGEITVINSTQFSITIDATTFDPFVIPPVVLILDPYGDPIAAPPLRQVAPGEYALTEFAQAVPFGENNAMLSAAVQNVLPY